MTEWGIRQGSNAGMILSNDSPTDSVRDLKKLVAAHTGTRPDKIRLQRWHSILKDHITLQDYEINHGGSIDMYYN